MLSIYGGTGIIGSYYIGLHGGQLIPRNQLEPLSDNVLYLISTTSNNYFNPLIHTDTNIDCLMKRMIACHQVGIKTFNFISSWFVYGPSDGKMKENNNCNPKGLYSITKHCAEQLVIDFCSYHGIQWKILRLANIYGGPDKSSGQRNALHYMIQELKANRSVQGTWGLSRDFLHIYDTCRAIELICNNGKNNSIYNIGSGYSTLQSDCLEFCKKVLGSTSDISFRSHGANEQSLVMSLDCNRIQSLGFRPLISMEEGLFDLCTNQKFSTPAHFSMEKKLALP